MSFDQVEQLLNKYKIAPNKVLGQNFMVEPSLYPKLCTYAALRPSLMWCWMLALALVF